MPGPKETRIGETRIGEHFLESRKLEPRVAPFLRPPRVEPILDAKARPGSKALEGFIALGEGTLPSTEIPRPAPESPAKAPLEPWRGNEYLQAIGALSRAIAWMPGFFWAAAQGPEALAEWNRSRIAEEAWHQDLVAFHQDRASIAEQIPHLTPELESGFERGARIIQTGDRYYLVGADQSATRPIGQAELEAYQAWRKQQGFSSGSFAQAQLAWAQAQGKAKAYGIVLSYERQGNVSRPDGLELLTHTELALFSEQISYLNELIGQLPKGFFGGSKLAEIRLVLDPAQRQYGDAISVYQDGTLRIGLEQLMGSRRNLIGWFFNGVGHVAVERFKNDAKMKEAYQSILDGKAVWGLDWHRGAEARKNLQKASLEEFLSEFTLAYVIAGGELRAYVKHAATRQGWEYFYEQYRENLFHGKEFNYDVQPESPYAVSRSGQAGPEYEVFENLEAKPQIQGGAVARWNFPDLVPSVGVIGEVQRVDGQGIVLRHARRRVKGGVQEIPGELRIEGTHRHFVGPIPIHDLVHWIPSARGVSEVSPLHETKTQFFREDLDEKVFAVHATNHLPAGGLIKSQPKNIPYFQPTLHWSLGGLVAPQEKFNWDSMKFAVVTPVGSLKKQMVNISPEDSFTLGDVQVPSDAILLVPSGTDVSVLRGRANVKEYKGLLRNAVRDLIQERDGWSIEYRRQHVLGDPEVWIAGVPVEPLEFFRPLLEENPHLSYGIHLSSKRGEAFRFGVIDQILIDTFQSYGQAALSTNEIKIRRHLLVDQVIKLESWLDGAPLSAEARRDFKQAKDAMLQWLNILEVELEMRRDHGKTLDPTDNATVLKVFSSRRSLARMREVLHEAWTELPDAPIDTPLQVQKLANAMSNMSPKEFKAVLGKLSGSMKIEEQAELKFHYVLRRWMQVRGEVGRLEGLGILLEDALRRIGARGETAKLLGGFLKKYAASDPASAETARVILGEPFVQQYLSERGISVTSLLP